MGLKDELKLKKGFEVPEHEAVLSVYFTASMLKKRADRFFSEHGTTDVQYNLLLLLYYQADDSGGLSQVSLSEMMLVNRANITSLVDRMEEAGLVKRHDDPQDRRTKIVKLTARAKKMVNKIDGDYIKEVREIMSGLSKAETQRLVKILAKVRENIPFRVVNSRVDNCK